MLAWENGTPGSPPTPKHDALHLRDVAPESLQTLRASKQRRENGRIGEQDVATAVTLRRHPEARIELPVSRGRERVRPGQINRLPAQYVNGFVVLGRQRIVGQVQMEVERCDPVQ